jgi:hypothetical protein
MHTHQKSSDPVSGRRSCARDAGGGGNRLHLVDVGLDWWRRPKRPTISSRRSSRIRLACSRPQIVRRKFLAQGAEPIGNTAKIGSARCGQA